MKTRFRKIYGLPFYIREVKRFPWQRWHLEKSEVLLPIVYWYDAGMSKFEKLESADVTNMCIKEEI